MEAGRLAEESAAAGADETQKEAEKAMNRDERSGDEKQNKEE